MDFVKVQGLGNDFINFLLDLFGVRLVLEMVDVGLACRMIAHRSGVDNGRSGAVVGDLGVRRRRVKRIGGNTNTSSKGVIVHTMILCQTNHRPTRLPPIRSAKAPPKRLLLCHLRSSKATVVK